MSVLFPNNGKWLSTCSASLFAISDDQAASIKNLRNPAKKMSKSEADPKSRINLTDSPDEILDKCKKAVTDFTSE